jgi:hypothetical protein
LLARVLKPVPKLRQVVGERLLEWLAGVQRVLPALAIEPVLRVIGVLGVELGLMRCRFLGRGTVELVVDLVFDLRGLIQFTPDALQCAPDRLVSGEVRRINPRRDTGPREVDDVLATGTVGISRLRL